MGADVNKFIKNKVLYIFKNKEKYIKNKYEVDLFDWRFTDVIHGKKQYFESCMSLQVCTWFSTDYWSRALIRYFANVGNGHF